MARMTSIPRNTADHGGTCRTNRGGSSAVRPANLPVRPGPQTGHPAAAPFPEQGCAACKLKKGQGCARQAAAQVLAPVAHPGWSPADDFRLLELKAQKLHFHRIAEVMDRPRIMVEQRWHRLRAIPRVTDLLSDFGLSEKRWPEALLAAAAGEVLE